MDTFTKVMTLGALALVLIVLIAVFVWVGILYYAALALAILFFPIIIAMCSGFGITGGGDEQHG